MTEAPLTDQDMADLESLAEAPVPRTLLEIWDALLEGLDEAAAERVTPMFASNLLNKWDKMTFKDIDTYQDRYYTYLRQLREIVREAIAENPKALKHTKPGEDAEKNRDIYIDLLYKWQAAIQDWEHAWNHASDDAAPWLAAIADATAFSVGPNGFVQHLETINFQFTEEDQAALRDRLLAHREELS